MSGPWTPYKPRKSERLETLVNLDQRPEDPTIGFCHDQAKSLFFARLPAEIRLVIYEHALGWRTIQFRVTSYWRRRKGTTNSSLRGKSLRQKVTGFYLDGQSADGMGSAQAKTEACRHILSLLQTCRLIYIEASDIAYKTNWFSVSLHISEGEVSRFLAPARFNTITLLKLDWPMDVKLGKNADPIDNIGKHLLDSLARRVEDVKLKFPQVRHLQLYGDTRRNSTLHLTVWQSIQRMFRQHVYELSQSLDSLIVFVYLLVEYPINVVGVIRWWCRVGPGMELEHSDGHDGEPLPSELLGKLGSAATAGNAC